MFRLHTLGALDLRRPDGREVGSVLAQPKRVALLAYLAMARPAGFHRRDTLLALFWPESDKAHARDALRQAVRYLRRSLDKEVLAGRGDDELGLDETLLWCDVTAFEQAAEDGRFGDALEFYRGELLPGFFLSDLPEFEAWLEVRRRELRDRAVDVACSLAARREAEGDAPGAARYARRALQLSPADEGTLRTLMALLDRSGDRASAVRAYEEFAARLVSEYKIAPSEESRALADRIRSDAVGEELVAIDEEEPGDRELGRSVPAATPETSISEAAETRNKEPHPNIRRSPLVRKLWLVAAVLLVAAVSARWVAGAWSHPRIADTAWVFPLENRTGDTTLDALGSWAADAIRDGLSRVRGLQVLDGSVRLPGSHTSPPSREDVQRLAHDIGGDMIISGALYGFGDSIQLQVQATDIEGRSVLSSIGPISGSLDQAQMMVTTLADRVTGALAASGDPWVVALNTEGSRPPSWAAYLAWADGLERYSRHDFRGALVSLLNAAALDSTGTFVSPLTWAAGAYGNMGEYAQADSLLRIVNARRDRLRPYDRALLDLLSAGYRGHLSEQHDAALRMLDAAPRSELALYLAGLTAISINHPNDAVRYLRRIDVEHTSVNWDEYDTHITSAYHLLGEHDEELKEARKVRSRRPELLRVELDELRALAALGRSHEVLQRLRRTLSLPSQPMITAGDVARITADELRAHGNPQAADTALAWARGWYESRAPAERTTEIHRFRAAEILYRTERWQEARARFDSLWRDDPDCVSCLGYVGGASAHLGEQQEATFVSDSLSRMNRPYLRGRNVMWQARIAAALGRQADAVRLVRMALGKGDDFCLCIHSDPDLMLLQDDPAFQALLQPAG